VEGYVNPVTFDELDTTEERRMISVPGNNDEVTLKILCVSNVSELVCGHMVRGERQSPAKTHDKVLFVFRIDADTIRVMGHDASAVAPQSGALELNCDSHFSWVLSVSEVHALLDLDSQTDQYIDVSVDRSGQICADGRDTRRRVNKTITNQDVLAAVFRKWENM